MEVPVKQGCVEKTLDPVGMYFRHGYAIFKALDDNQVKRLKRFAFDWMYRLLDKWVKDQRNKFPLETYHLWYNELQIDHETLFRAENRYTIPEPSIHEVLFNPMISLFLKKIGLIRYKKWDDGLGWLAFRFIRPGAGDGYPTSRKAWGPAKNVVSCWIPIIGYDSSTTLSVVPGSHLKEYEKYLPPNSKFMKGEYRLKNPLANSEYYQPNLGKGDLIFYHPMLLHSEDIIESKITRFNLEYRLNPTV